MKINLFCLTLILFLLSCGKKNPSQKNTTPLIQNIAVVVYDISISTDAFAMLQASDIYLMYHKMGVNNGGKFYGLFIKTNSKMQDPYMQVVPALQLIEIKGNAYQQQNRINRNKEIAVQYEKGAVDFVKTASAKMMLPKTEDFSDIQHALELANSILSMPEYANWNKQLLIISDMENDFPPINGIDKMQPVKFKPDVKIAVVRQSSNVNVSEMIGGSEYTPYPTIPDAINSFYK